MIALSTRLESRLEYLYLSTEPHYLRYLEEDEKNFLTQEFGFSRKELRDWWVTRQWKDRRKKIARKQAQAMVDSSTEDSQDSHFEENSIVSSFLLSFSLSVTNRPIVSKLLC